MLSNAYKQNWKSRFNFHVIEVSLNTSKSYQECFVTPKLINCFISRQQSLN